MQIVGIVDDIKEGPLDAATRPTMYVAFAQDPTSGFAVFARTSQAERSLLPAMAAAINQLDPRLSTSRGTTMSSIINDSEAAYSVGRRRRWSRHSRRWRGCSGSSACTASSRIR